MIDPQRNAATTGNGSHRREDSGEEYSDLLPPTVRDTLAEQEVRMREFILAHPVSMVFGALALGFVVARTIRVAVSE